VPFQPVVLRGQVATMPRGTTPTVAKVGRDALLQWFPQDIVPGTPVQRYVVTRHSAVDADLVEELPATTATTVTDPDVSAGKWYWTVRPVFALWRGAESRKSDRLTFTAPLTARTTPQTGDGTGTAAAEVQEPAPVPTVASPTPSGAALSDPALSDPALSVPTPSVPPSPPVLPTPRA
jgi:hypothetical protein